MVKNPDLVYEKAEEMAAKYREQLRKQAAEQAMAEVGDGDDAYSEEEEVALAVD
jgi:small subunit ribosomal protein S1